MFCNGICNHQSVGSSVGQSEVCHYCVGHTNGCWCPRATVCQVDSYLLYTSTPIHKYVTPLNGAPQVMGTTPFLYLPPYYNHDKHSDGAHRQPLYGYALRSPADSPTHTTDLLFIQHPLPLFEPRVQQPKHMSS